MNMEDYKDPNKEFVCKCKEKYNVQEMIKLNVLYLNLGLNSENIFNYLYKKYANICCICSKTQNLKYYTYPSVDKAHIDISKDEINIFLEKMVHLLCDDCFHKSGAAFNCQLCKFEHFSSQYSKLEKK